jgi:hypothetical protein
MLYLVKSNENELKYVDLRKKMTNLNEKWNNIYFCNLILKKKLVSEISHAIFS